MAWGPWRLLVMSGADANCHSRSNSWFASQIISAQKRTRAAENAELRRRNEEAEEQEFGRDEEDTSGEGKAVRIFLVWLPPGSSI